MRKTKTSSIQQDQQFRQYIGNMIKTNSQLPVSSQQLYHLEPLQLTEEQKQKLFRDVSVEKQGKKGSHSMRKLPTGVFSTKTKKGGYISVLHRNGRPHHLGTFNSIEEASQVRNKARHLTDEEFKQFLKNKKRPLPTGVYRRKDTNKFYAGIRRNGHVRYLGTFDSSEEASQARKKAEKQFIQISQHKKRSMKK